MPDLHADLFSRHASPLEVYVFVAVDERGEDVVSDETCHLCNGKQRRRRGGRNVQLPDRVMNKIKRQHILYCCSYLGHQNEVAFVGGISEYRPKSEPFVFIRLFRIRGPISTCEGGRKGGREVLNEEARVAAICQKKIK